MIVPGRLILVLALLGVGATALVMFQPVLAPVVLLADVALLLTVLLVGKRLRPSDLEVTLEWPNRLEVDREVQLVYRVANRGPRGLEIRLRPHLPPEMSALSREVQTRVEKGEVVRLAISARARSRGKLPASVTEIELRDGLDLARRRWQIAAPEMVVYPSLRGIADFEKLKNHRAVGISGIHSLRMLGAGREFDQLRDYQNDDDYWDINWKATAHHGRPITSLYRAERHQDLMLCMDCGRMMGNPVGDSTALDRAVDAAILLAHIASRQSDRVGLIQFGDQVERYIAPTGGMGALRQLVDALVETRPRGVFPSYTALVEALRQRQKRRCMGVVFTDLNDPQLAANLAEVLPLVSRRHVMVVVSLRDTLLDRVASGPARETREVYRILAARELANERAAHARALSKAGVHVLDADAEGLSVTLINTYLRLKARQLV